MGLSLEQTLSLAEEALEAGELETAVGLVTQVLQKAPNDGDALEIQGLALAEMGDVEGADKTFATLLKLDPDNVTALIAAADLKIRQPGDDPERSLEGLALLDRAEDQARLIQALEIELDLLKGIALSQLAEFEEAQEAFTRVLELDPENGEARLEQSIALFEQGRFQEAQRGFAWLSKEFPQEAWPFHYQGLLAERRGEDAESWFHRARALAPEEFPRPAHLSSADFEAAVNAARANLSAQASLALANAVICVEPFPSDADIKEGLSPSVLGVLRGDETMRVTLFQRNLERFSESREALVEEIRLTLASEVS